MAQKTTAKCFLCNLPILPIDHFKYAVARYLPLCHPLASTSSRQPFSQHQAPSSPNGLPQQQKRAAVRAGQVGDRAAAQLHPVPHCTNTGRYPSGSIIIIFPSLHAPAGSLLRPGALQRPRASMQLSRWVPQHTFLWLMHWLDSPPVCTPWTASWIYCCITRALRVLLTDSHSTVVSTPLTMPQLNVHLY